MRPFARARKKPTTAPSDCCTIVRAPIKEHVPPDVQAAQFWLKKRRPDRWRDVQQLAHVLGKYIHIISDWRRWDEMTTDERVAAERLYEEAANARVATRARGLAAREQRAAIRAQRA